MIFAAVDTDQARELRAEIKQALGKAQKRGIGIVGAGSSIIDFVVTVSQGALRLGNLSAPSCVIELLV